MRGLQLTIVFATMLASGVGASPAWSDGRQRPAGAGATERHAARCPPLRVEEHERWFFIEKPPCANGGLEVPPQIVVPTVSPPQRNEFADCGAEGCESKRRREQIEDSLLNN